MSIVHKIRRRDMLVAGGMGTLAGASGLILGFYGGRRKERWAKDVPQRPQAFSPMCLWPSRQTVKRPSG